ncbi:MAG: hypothetical protein E6J03_11250 [Chloroflexi bacterium]|nr:MAG: hypothetical protein E6J03_11250 [Chloroflexota bacterium]
MVERGGVVRPGDAGDAEPQRAPLVPRQACPQVEGAVHPGLDRGVAEAFAVGVDELVGAEVAQAAREPRHRLADRGGVEVDGDVALGTGEQQRRQPPRFDRASGQAAQPVTAHPDRAGGGLARARLPGGTAESLRAGADGPAAPGVVHPRRQRLALEHLRARAGGGERSEDGLHRAVEVRGVALGRGDEEQGAAEGGSGAQARLAVLRLGGAEPGGDVGRRRGRLRAGPGRIAPAADLEDDLEVSVEGVAEARERSDRRRPPRLVERGEVEVRGAHHRGAGAAAPQEVAAVDAHRPDRAVPPSGPERRDHPWPPTRSAR